MSTSLEKSQPITDLLSKERVMVIEKISKKFCKNLKRSMWYGSRELALNVLGFHPNTSELRRDEFWALDEVSFELRRGDILGLIGLNGSGKTTLVSLLAGIFPPDRGEIAIRGQVGSLIALGAGFHPHMTGRENVFLNAVILGMTRKEVQERYDDIVDFADIHGFMDTPVSAYSSGMKVRLGFAIAIHCEPDILLVDEVLAVGDVSFRNKCLRKMKELREKASAMIFISHQLTNVRAICNRVIVLDHGKIVHDGNVNEGIAKYRSISHDVALADDDRNLNKVNVEDMVLTDAITFIRAGLLDVDGKHTNKIAFGEDIRIYYEFQVNRPIEMPLVSMGVWDSRDMNIVAESNLYEFHGKIEIPDFVPGKKYRVVCVYQDPNIVPGNYKLNVGVEDGKTYERHHLRIREDIVIEGKTVHNFVIDGVRPPICTIELKTDWSCGEIAEGDAIPNAPDAKAMAAPEK